MVIKIPEINVFSKKILGSCFHLLENSGNCSNQCINQILEGFFGKILIPDIVSDNGFKDFNGLLLSLQSAVNQPVFHLKRIGIGNSVNGGNFLIGDQP